MMNLLRTHIRGFLNWALHTEGSSRSSALLRIGLALIAWARWAYEFTLFHDSYSPVLTILFFTSTSMMLLGYYSRLATFTTALILFATYLHGGLVLHIGPSHHTYMLAMAVALCALTPCGKSYSLDRWLAVMRAKKEQQPVPAEWGNLWGLRLMSLQVSLMYFWTAYDKTSYAFLSGERLEAIFMHFYVGSAYPEIPFFPVLTILISIFIVFYEYAIGFGLLFEKTRSWFIITGLIFHGILYITLPIATFSVTIALMYLAYINAATVHRVIDEM